MQFRKLLTIAALALGLGTGSALAVDPLYSPAPAMNWSGLYLGVQGGGAMVRYTDSTTLAPTTVTWNANGLVAGVLAGYNVQYRDLVFGLQGDINWIRANGTVPANLATGTSQTQWLATLQGRIGKPVGSNMLLHAGGGIAALSNVVNVGVPPTTNTHLGAVGSLGLDYAMGNGMILGVEGRYYGFQAKTYNPTPSIGTFLVLVSLQIALSADAN